MFACLIDVGTYVEAGERLHVAHSAIHRQVKLLEEEVGERLFYREDGRLQLTSPGQQVAELAGRILKDIANVTRRLRENRALESGRVVLGTGTTMILYFLPKVLDRFRRQYEGVEVQVMTGTATEVATAIRHGSLDLGIVFTTTLSGAGDPGLRFVPLYTEEFVLIVPPSISIRGRKTIPVSKLHGMPVITFSRSSSIRHFIESQLATAGVQMNVKMELENEEAIDQMVKSNAGAGFVSKSRALAEKLRFFAIKDIALSACASAVYSARIPLSLASQEFLKTCLECTKKSASLI